jgi:hypothetical protein
MPVKKENKYVDLRSPSDLPKFNKLIKSFEKKGIYILVHADFCGPCQNYKQTVWNDLVENQNRKAGMAGIHYDQFDKSPFSHAKIKGYPSVLYVSSNGSVKQVSNFNDSQSGSVTNAMPASDMRNKELMEKLVNAEPSEVPTLLPSMEKSNNVIEEEEEPEFDEETTILRNKVNSDDAIKEAKLNESKNNGVNEASPPKMDKDLILDSQKASNSTSSPLLNFDPSVSGNNTPKQGKGSVTGGSLYSSLLNAARRKAHKTNKASKSSKGKSKKKRRT